MLNDDKALNKIFYGRVSQGGEEEDNREMADRNFAPRFAKCAQRCLAKLQDCVKTQGGCQRLFAVALSDMIIPPRRMAPTSVR